MDSLRCHLAPTQVGAEWHKWPPKRSSHSLAVWDWLREFFFGKFSLAKLFSGNSFSQNLSGKSSKNSARTNECNAKDKSAPSLQVRQSANLVLVEIFRHNRFSKRQICAKFRQFLPNFPQIFFKFSPIFVNFHHFAHQIGRNDGNSSPTMRETRIGSLSAVNLAEIGRNLRNSGQNFSKWAPSRQTWARVHELRSRVLSANYLQFQLRFEFKLFPV